VPRFRPRVPRLLFAPALLLLGLAAAARADVYGPASGLLPDGRQLHPFGRQLDLGGNFSHGAALTPNGRFLWTVQAGEGHDDVRVVSLAEHRIIQTLPLPGASGGIAIAPDGRHAYVSGEPDAGERPGGDVPVGFPGRSGDVVHAFAVDPTSGIASETGVFSVAPPAGTAPPQDFPPTRTKALGWPQEIAVSPDGDTLLVALSLADRAAIVDTRTGAVRFVAVGSYPYGAAILPDGRTGLVSDEGPGAVSVVDLMTATKLTDIRVGDLLSHPQGIALDRSGAHAYVALANADGVAVLDTAGRALQRTISLAHPEGGGASPITASVTPDGSMLLVPEAAADDVAIVGLAGAALLGRIPTADYPVAALAVPGGALPCAAAGSSGSSLSPAGARPARRPARRAVRHRRPHRLRRPVSGSTPPNPNSCAKLVWVAGKGLGLGSNTTRLDPRYADNAERQLGRIGVADLPSARVIAAQTAVANAQLRPSNPQSPPVGTPLRAGGPIKHVFYFVRENRNYDQVLGDLDRGDGDPALAVFGKSLTPNMHALADRFGDLDRTFTDSEVSIDGHFWTSAGQVSDFVERNNHPSNAGRNYPYDFVYSIAWPQGGFLFDQADARGVSWFNFGEGIAGVLPLPDKDRPAADDGLVSGKFGRSDLGAPQGCYPSDAYIGHNPITGALTFDSSPPPGAPANSESRYDCFQRKFTAMLASGTVPKLTYLVNVDDHTQGTAPGQRTPQAMMASSDWGLGQFVDLISHSSIWSSSAIFVIEDDAQEGYDHVDAHRTVAFAISPYSPRGAVISTRYDQLSVLRSIEILLGLHPLGLADALATPMYDAFTAAPANKQPYSAVVPAVNMAAMNTTASPAAALSSRLDLYQPDRVPQRVLDTIDWQAVHGAGSRVPPEGPNAVKADG
jgi:DNA-binding beta-propeller fold protein YncE